MTAKAGAPLAGRRHLHRRRPGRHRVRLCRHDYLGRWLSDAGTCEPRLSGGFVVTGAHTYGSGGSDPTTVSIADVGGANTIAHATATVKRSAPVVTAHPLWAATPRPFPGRSNPEGLPTTASFEYGLDSRYSTAGNVRVRSTTTRRPLSPSARTSRATRSRRRSRGWCPTRCITSGSSRRTAPARRSAPTSRSRPTAARAGRARPRQDVQRVVDRARADRGARRLRPAHRAHQDPQRHDHQRAARDAVADDRRCPRCSTRSICGEEESQEAQDQDAEGQVRRRACSRSPRRAPAWRRSALVEGAKFKGAPSFASCKAKKGKAVTAALSSKTLQLLHGERPRQVPHEGPLRRGDRPRHDLDDRRPLRRNPDPRDHGQRHRHRLRPPQDDHPAAGHSYLALAKPKKHKSATSG